jgi:membrane-associated phospholipid phosphatase
MPAVVVLVFIISGLVLSSRLWLRAHTPEQIYTGFLAGLTIMGLGMMI